MSDKLALIENKARNLLEVLGGNGKRNNNAGFIVKELDELELQAGQLSNEIEGIEFEANDLENKIMSADLIRDNFKVLKDVYDPLTPHENTTSCTC